MTDKPQDGTPSTEFDGNKIEITGNSESEEREKDLDLSDFEHVDEPGYKDKKKKTFIVVSGDGGGMKGINVLTLLAEIAKKAGASTQEYGFMHVGCSTSTLASGGLIVPDDKDPKKAKYNELDIRSFYFNDGPVIFPHKKNDLSDFQKAQLKERGLMKGESGLLRFIFNGSFFDDKNLRRVLQDRYGDTKAKDCLDPFVFPTTDFKKGRPIWFTNTPEVAERFEDVYYVPEMKMSEIIEACTRANFYFRYREMDIHHKQKNHETGQWEDAVETIIPTDGAYFAGSPEAYAYDYAKSLLAAKGYKEDEYRIIMLSVGTGKKLTNNDVEQLNGQKGFWSRRFKSLAQLSGFATTAELALTLQYRSRRAELKEKMNRSGDLYFRFDAEMNPENPDHPDANLSNASIDNMRKLVRFARNVVIPENQEEFDTFVEIVKRHQKGLDIEHIAQERLDSYYTPLTKAKSKKAETLDDKIKKKPNIWDSWFGSGDKKKKNKPKKKDKKPKKLVARM